MLNYTIKALYVGISILAATALSACSPLHQKAQQKAPTDMQSVCTVASAMESYPAQVFRERRWEPRTPDETVLATTPPDKELEDTWTIGLVYTAPSHGSTRGSFGPGAKKPKGSLLDRLEGDSETYTGSVVLLCGGTRYEVGLVLDGGWGVHPQVGDELQTNLRQNPDGTTDLRQRPVLLPNQKRGVLRDVPQRRTIASLEQRI